MEEIITFYSPPAAAPSLYAYMPLLCPAALVCTARPAGKSMQAARWMEPFNRVVEITHGEAYYHDDMRGWRECMPPGWEFRSDSIFPRLIQAEIPLTMSASAPSRDAGARAALIDQRRAKLCAS